MALWWVGVAIPLLKFMTEFVHNKAQRLQFDCSSPNGILLFRETSKIICTLCTSRAHHSSSPLSLLSPSFSLSLSHCCLCLLTSYRCLSIATHILQTNPQQYDTSNLYRVFYKRTSQCSKNSCPDTSPSRTPRSR